MTEEEELLLTRYHEYKRKRRKIIIVAILVTLAIIGGSGYLYYLKTNEDKQVVTKDKDDTPPKLVLTDSQITVKQNDEIDYQTYIKSCVDNKDGDIVKEVKYKEIDTSVVGEYIVVYQVSDKAKNKTQKELKVIVEEKIEVSQEPTPTNDNPQDQQGNVTNNSNTNTNQNQTSNTNKKDNTSNNSSSNNSVSNQPKTRTKDFLFSDGYNMGNVGQACASELSGKKGRCEPIVDSEGITKGMRLTIEE